MAKLFFWSVAIGSVKYVVSLGGRGVSVIFFFVVGESWWMIPLGYYGVPDHG